MKFKRDAVRVQGIIAAFGVMAAAGIVGCGGDSPSNPGIIPQFPLAQASFAATASGNAPVGNPPTLQNVNLPGTVQLTQGNVNCPVASTTPTTAQQQQLASISPTITSLTQNGNPVTLGAGPVVVTSGDRIAFTVTTPNPVDALLFTVSTLGQTIAAGQQQFDLTSFPNNVNAGQVGPLVGPETISGSFVVPPSATGAAYLVTFATRSGAICTSSGQTVQINVSTGSTGTGR